MSVVPEISSISEAVAANSGLRLLVLYGSRARGDAHGRSDWDSDTSPTTSWIRWGCSCAPRRVGDLLTLDPDVLAEKAASINRQ